MDKREKRKRGDSSSVEVDRVDESAEEYDEGEKIELLSKFSRLRKDNENVIAFDFKRNGLRIHASMQRQKYQIPSIFVRYVRTKFLNLPKEINW